jgi:signal transduction histidine kinase/HPt (histidine-containing phosphotransfer) domain-containing protein
MENVNKLRFETVYFWSAGIGLVFLFIIVSLYCIPSALQQSRESFLVGIGNSLDVLIEANIERRQVGPSGHKKRIQDFGADSKEFSRILQQDPVEEAGRVYAVSKQEWLRAEEQFSESLSGSVSTRVGEYQNDSGVLVYGVWKWNDALGLGIVAEIEAEKALAPYYSLQRTIFTLFGMILFFICAGMLFVLIFGGRACQMMKATHEYLEQEISKRTAALQENEKNLRKALRDSEAAAQAKSAFLANMSHEIRTPMNSIIGFTDIVLQSDLNQAQRNHLNTVSQSAKSLLSLINAILDLSKLEEGKVELSEVVFVLPQMIEDVFSHLRGTAQKKNIMLHLYYDEKLPSCFIGDPFRLKQVLVNLVGNAIKFTDHGTVSLSVDSACEEDFLHFTVKDTGIGIATDRLEKIFSPFAQVDTSTTRKHGGSGLGTTISRQIVERMSGRIWAESEEHKGSAFHFIARLPQGDCTTGCTGICVNGWGIAEQDVTDDRDFNVLLSEDISEQAASATVRFSSVEAAFSVGNHEELLPYLPGLDTKSGLKLWCDSELYRKSLHSFVQRHGKDGERVRQALSRKDLKTAREIIHGLKGVAGNLGVFDVADRAHSLNKALKNPSGNYDRNGALDELDKALSVVVRSIELLNNQGGNKQEILVELSECDTERIRQVLVDLLHAFDKGDLDHIEDLLDQLKGCFSELQVAELVQQVTDFEFRAAENTVKKLVALVERDLG